MSQLLTPMSAQDFARNQVGALADSVLAVEPGSDNADADAVGPDDQQLHGGGLHMSDAGGACADQLYWCIKHECAVLRDACMHAVFQMPQQGNGSHAASSHTAYSMLESYTSTVHRPHGRVGPGRWL